MTNASGMHDSGSRILHELNAPDASMFAHFSARQQIQLAVPEEWPSGRMQG
tara:strand:+ start:2985 stop:3137 length:153 start_codon:yes stop_codon:yes gene_type:complete